MKSELKGLAKLVDEVEKGHLLSLMLPPDTRRWVSKDEVLHLARRLLAEEEAEREQAPVKLWKQCPQEGQECGPEMCDGTYTRYDGLCLRPCRPAPSRTGELVRKLRDLIDRRYPGGVRGAWGNDIEEILRDFEVGE